MPWSEPPSRALRAGGRGAGHPARGGRVRRARLGDLTPGGCRQFSMLRDSPDTTVPSAQSRLCGPRDAAQSRRGCRLDERNGAKFLPCRHSSLPGGGEAWTRRLTMVEGGVRAGVAWPASIRRRSSGLGRRVGLVGYNGPCCRRRGRRPPAWRLGAWGGRRCRTSEGRTDRGLERRRTAYRCPTSGLTIRRAPSVISGARAVGRWRRRSRPRARRAGRPWPGPGRPARRC
jgi:hypothetical protein